MEGRMSYGAQKLREYLVEREETHADFADRAGIHRVTISSILSGARVPGRTVMAKIELATKGRVACEHWFKPETKSISPIRARASRREKPQ